ncbi:MAG: ACP S-malonyltransferase [Bacteroidales bacterium]|nr:ACP S-malonyltransferase [Bacteroidales bacterium]
MKAYVFPGQGAQYIGMGKELYEKSNRSKELFEKANEILGFRITDIMFDGTPEELKQTKVTQPAIFLHSVIWADYLGDDFKPEMVAGHSLGEFSALVANKVLSFEDGLRLVSKRAMAMQEACDLDASTMAAILGLDDELVVKTCSEINETEILVAANFNCPGQLVISGSEKGIDIAIEKFKELGAKRALKLQVSGAFHSPFMKPAQEKLEKAISETNFNNPICPVYQNATGKSCSLPEKIKQNLIDQLTAPVLWTQSAKNMIADGASEFIELGPGKVLQGLVKKIDRNITVSGFDKL